MTEEISSGAIKKAVGKKVEVLAFGINYAGVLKKVDFEAGLVRIEDGKDYVVLEIERIEGFKVLPR